MNSYEKELPQCIYMQSFDNPFIGICVTDGKGVAIAVNEAQTRITSIPANVFIGKYMGDFVNEKIFSISSTVEVLKSKEEVLLRQEISNGKSYHVKGVPIFGEDGKIEHVISYLLDISELEEVKKVASSLAADKEKIEHQMKSLKEALDKSGNIIYQSKSMRNIVEMTKRVALSDATVLITGPSGSGKELIANMVHEESRRNAKPFIKINCAAIPEQLLESEIFGYEAGAFTGGSPKGRKGLFEAANGGTLLFDEIGEMPLNLQAKLLRVLQDQYVRRIGARKPVKVDVRLMASTNASLKQLMKEKKFREDLYYRINVIEIKLPSLAERKEDIPILIEHFMRAFNTKYELNKSMHYDAVSYLTAREYPGNVRELKNIVERLVIQSPDNEITSTDVFEILDDFHLSYDVIIGSNINKDTSLKELLEEYEGNLIKEYIRIYKTPAKVAQVLKTDRTTVSRKMKRYGLPK